jgi:hypothetical protein
MIEQQIQQLKSALQELVNAIMNSGEPVTEELEVMLVQAMEHVATRIQQLRQQENEEEPVEGLPPAGGQPSNLTEAMPSSNIEGFAYDDKTGKLLVRFLGGHPNRNGPIYGYQGVPPEIFEIFRKGAIPAKTNGKNKWGKWWQGKYPSMGAAMNHLIKAGGYPYQRLS